ncbi:O-antigen ligase family protein [Amycolatopsis panacis]|uniref:O-antigen ligase domain-containing protein n=1 Tax=Amycolatopsis panacis TaxID=2340917 RepID=A0A419I3B9_9PSEU|nr:O-antigen ligase family protein [Amycolatopsis panacis]RJQ84569.1 O-antigen ligase domain-containing protein [Amycolatopsis panacis]
MSLLQRPGLRTRLGLGEFIPIERSIDRHPWLSVLLLGGGVLAVCAQVFVPDLAFLVLAITALLVGYMFSPKDEVTGLTLLLSATFLLPANLVIGPLGQAGVPSGLFATALLLVWFCLRCAPDLGTDRQFQPLRVVVMFAVVSQLASYAAGQIRGLSPLEASGANAGLLGELGAIGVLLFTADTLRDIRSVRLVLSRVTMGAAVLAFVAALQFFSVIDLAKLIRLPGLTVHASTADFVQSRDGFNRVAGLATHPIEYGVVLSMALPLALHLAVTARRHRPARWLIVVMIAGGIPLSIGRSAILATAVALLIYLGSLRLRTLLNLLPFAVVGLIGVQAAAPGLLTSIKGLFTNAGTDPSIEGRTDDYAAVFGIWQHHPFFGIGPGTYVPKLYRVLDNEYLYELVTVGVVGLAVGLALFATGYSLARRVRRSAPDPDARGMGQALAGSIAAAAVAAFTFDAFGFAIMFITTHLLIGCAAALWRVSVRDVPEAERLPAGWLRRLADRRRWAAT